jgi:chromosome segregation protein
MGYIRRLEIKGFKSVSAKPITVNLEPGLTVITGPNGSGKSNVADAILFVLGENSPKTMRAAQGKLVGLIYDPKNVEGASEEALREKPNSCRVTIQLDNFDRKIAIDTDFVTVTRELKDDGESSYFLNGKRTTKSALAEILDLAGLAPGGLNIVTQGTATRVAELTPEEKRRMIEESIGIAKFEEKKAEAQRQLSQADQRLEVARARTGEMKSTLENLDLQRNEMMRFEQLGGQINWLKAVRTSRKIIELNEKISSLKGVHNELTKKVDELVQRGTEFESRVSSIEAEKNKFIVEVVQGGGSSQVELQFQLASINDQLNRLSDQARLAEESIRKLESETIPSLKTILSEKEDRCSAAQKHVQKISTELRALEARRAGINNQLNDFVKAEETLRLTIDKRARHTENIQAKLSDLSQRLVEIDSEANSAEAVLGAETRRLDELKSRVDNFSKLLSALETNTSQLFSLHLKATKELDSIQDDLSVVEERKSKMRETIDIASRTLDKASGEVSKEVARRDLAESISSGRPSQDRLRDMCEKGGVPGYVGKLDDLIKFPQQHSKAVLAVLGRWRDALVVKDLRSMSVLIKAAKAIGAKSFSVVPVSEVREVSAVRTSSAAGVVGPVSSVIKTESAYRGLVNFLAGDTVLVEGEGMAYLLSSEGFRTVTTNGEVFEAGGRAFASGVHERMLDVLEGLQDIEGIAEIEDAVLTLRNAIQKRNEDIDSLETEAHALGKERIKRIATVASLKAEADSISRVSQRYRAVLRSMIQDYSRQERLVNKYSKRLASLQTKRDSIQRGTASLRNTIAEFQELQLDQLLREVEFERREIQARAESLRDEASELSLNFTKESANLEQMLVPSLNKLKEDLQLSEEKYGEDTALVRGSTGKLRELNERKADSQSKIDKVIESSKRSQPFLDEFDVKIRRLKEERDAVRRSELSVEKERLANDQAIISTEDKLQETMGSLRLMGYQEILDVFESSDYLLSELEREYDALATQVNRSAHRDYKLMYQNYRDLSVRYNDLERERNAIVQFMESVETEKMKVFITAYEKVDRELGLIFNRLTGGKARLDLERPEDIFSGGVLLMASFPGKPAWESTSLSGGEKAVSAVSLILAIQSVQPHPFYLFDEIEANLDAVNSSNLAAFLKERSQMAQIIGISLRDTFVAESTVTYGMYSVEGISRMVRYKPGIEVKVKGG